MDNRISLTFLFDLNGQATQALSCPNLHSLVKVLPEPVLISDRPHGAPNQPYTHKVGARLDHRIQTGSPRCIPLAQQRNAPQGCSFKVTMTRFDANTGSIHTYKKLDFFRVVGR